MKVVKAQNKIFSNGKWNKNKDTIVKQVNFYKEINPKVKYFIKEN